MSSSTSAATASTFTTSAPTPSAAVSSNTPAPKFGGLGGPQANVPWTGGKPKDDFSGTTRTSPRTAMCYSLLEPDKAMKVYLSKTQGNVKKFSRNDQSYPLASFANDALRHMETYGMDTVFYLPDPGSKKLVDVFTSHSRFTKTNVSEWITKCTAATGPDNHYADEYSRDILEQSGIWLYNSLDDKLRASLMGHYGSQGNASGPVLWMAIVLEVQSDSYRRYKELVKQMERLQLGDFKGENVVDFVTSMRLCCEELERAQQLPKDITLTILNAFCSSSVEEFRGAFIPRRPMIENFLIESEGKDPTLIATLPNRVTFYSILDDGLSLYRSLVDSNRWGPAKGEGVSANLALVPKVGGGNGRSKNSGGKLQNPSSGEKIPTSPKSTGPTEDKDAWKKISPKSGESKVREVGKLTWHWCDKCTHWRVGHDTASHQDKPPKETHGNVALVPAFHDDSEWW